MAAPQVTPTNGTVTLEDLNGGLTEIQDQVSALSSGVRLVGSWDAGGGAFPTARPDAAAIEAGDAWLVSGAGTVDGIAFAVGDRLVALVDGGGASYTGAWVIAQYSDLLSGYEKRPFADRAAAEAATIPAPVMRISVISHMRTLNYIRDASGTALSTNGGTVNWSPDGKYNVLHWGPEADDTADDRGVILAAIAGTPEGTTLHFPNLAFYISDQIQITGRDHTRLKGEFGTTIRCDGDHKVFFVRRGQFFEFNTLGLKGDGDAAKTAQTGITASDAVDVLRVIHCRITDFGYDGVNTLFGVTNFRATGNYVARCNDDGINPGGHDDFPSSQNNIITGNTVEDCGSDGIHISWQSHGTTCDNNTVSGCNVGIGLFACKGAVVSGNILLDNTYAGVYLQSWPCRDLTITGNIIEGGQYGIDAARSGRRITVTENNISGFSDGGIAFRGLSPAPEEDGGQNLHIRGNTVNGFRSAANNGTRGIVIRDEVTNIRVNDNDVLNCTDFGILIALTTFTWVTGRVNDNGIYGGCSDAGIRVSNAGRLNLLSNSFSIIDGDGINLAASSEDCLVENPMFFAVTGTDINDNGTDNIIRLRDRA